MYLSSDPAFIPMPSPPLNGCNGGMRERAPSWSDEMPQAAMQSFLGLDACCRAQAGFHFCSAKLCSGVKNVSDWSAFAI